MKNVFFFLMLLMSGILSAQCNAYFTYTVDPSGNVTCVAPQTSPAATFNWTVDAVQANTNGSVLTFQRNPNTMASMVCLTVMDMGVACTHCDSIYTGGSNCLVPITFDVTVDTTSNPFTATISNVQSAGVGPYVIDWNDGNTSTVNSLTPNPTHAYTQTGHYIVCMSDGVGCYGCQSFQVGPQPNNCDATFNYTTDPAVPGITFQASFPGGPNTTYTWNIDSVYYTTTSPSFYYQNMNAAYACLTIQNAACSDTYCTTIGGSTGCAGGFTSFPDSIGGFYVDAWSQGVAPFMYEWSFNGVSAGNTASINIGAAGMACVTITDANGCVATHCDSIGGGQPGGCQAMYVFYQDSLNSQPFNLNLVNVSSSSNPAATSYFWDFGDGSTSTDPYPTHNYNQTGSYLLCLTISDLATNCTSTYCDSIGMDSLGNILFRGNVGFTLNVLNPTVLDVHNQSNETALNIFPNPTSGELTVEHSLTGEVSMSVYNVLGANVYTANSISTQTQKIDVRALPTGVYILSLKNAKEQKSIKFIKD